MREGHWISVGQAAQALELPYQQTIRAVYEGHLKAEMIAGRWRVDPDSVEAFRRVLGLGSDNLTLGGEN